MAEKKVTKTSTAKKSVAQKPSIPEEKVDVNSVDLAEENANLKVQLNEMMSQYKEMQLQMQNLLLAAQAQNANKNDGSTKVGCRIFNGATLCSQGGDISIPIQYREEVEVDYSELREIFKNQFNYKNMFRKGTLYFPNAEDYKRFSIKPEIDLSDESLLEILVNEKANRIVDIMKIMTNDKKDLTEMFAIIYQIAYLIDHKDIDLEYEKRSSLEKYFDVDFKTLIDNLHKK